MSEGSEEQLNASLARLQLRPDSPLQLSVSPMSGAELPATAATGHPRLPTLVAALGLLLLLQVITRLIAPISAPPAQLTIVQLKITPLANAPDILQVSARLRNQTDSTMALPALNLRFSNTYGEAVAGGSIAPARYAHGSTELLPGQQVQLRFLIQNPGHKALNYTLSLEPRAPPKK